MPQPNEVQAMFSACVMELAERASAIVGATSEAGLEFRTAVLAAHLTKQLLERIDFTSFIEAGRRCESIGATLDPTAYRANRTALAQDLAVLEAADRFVAAVRAAKDR